PDYKLYFAPNVARRLGKILKRAMLTARQVREATGIANPDAIITGTGLGCIEESGFFLDALTYKGEEFLQPTHFMQSTHNTISSLIAIDAGCRGYNSTYAHKGVSFECALADAFVQLEGNRIQTALVGAHDEMTPSYFILLKRIGYLGHAVNGFSGETSVSMMLGTAPTSPPLCRLRGVAMQYCPNEKELQLLLRQLLQQAQCRMEQIDAVMTGVNGLPSNDKIYAEVCPALFPGKRLLGYKHIFGESYTAPGLGVYASSVFLHQQRIPARFFIDSEGKEQHGVKHILFYNQFENKNHSLTLLSSCGK
ncbi:MAG: beta-ketoacyl synthase chain length factor, partial [Prevotellaceae bacterium]|nr:beta-ketoacyl synthase chain length factor [Prevotellaceae bacterium]